LNLIPTRRWVDTAICCGVHCDVTAFEFKKKRSKKTELERIDRNWFNFTLAYGHEKEKTLSF